MPKNPPNLTAYFDDSFSNTGDQKFFIAGYLNREDKWSLFNLAWHEAISDEPAINHFHAVEANALRGEFFGWSPDARDAKISRLAYVIRHFRPVSFEVSIGGKRLKEELSGLAPRGFSDPYYLCASAIMPTTARVLRQSGIKLPIKFVFDQQPGAEATLDVFFEDMVSDFPRDIQPMLNQPPLFADDISTPALQAADMLAWSIRRQHEKRDRDAHLMDLLRAPGAHYISEIDANAIEEWKNFYLRTPYLDQMQTKSEWRNIKTSAKKFKAAGFRPPYGNSLKNRAFKISKIVGNFFGNQ